MKICHAIKISRNNCRPLDIFCMMDTFCTYTGAPCLSPSCPLMEHQARFGFPPSVTYDKVGFFPLCVRHKAGKLRSTAALLLAAPVPLFTGQCVSETASQQGVCCGISAAFGGVCLSAACFSLPPPPPPARSCARLFFPASASCVCCCRVCVCATRALPCGLRMSADREVGRNSV